MKILTTLVQSPNPVTAVSISKIEAQPISGAVFPESIYLEPILGQIWPRIG